MLVELITGGVASLLSGIFGVVDQAVEDKDKAAEIKASIEKSVLTFQTVLLNAAAQIITAEANGGSWLQRNWRPLTMMTFVGLVVAKWLGFTAPGVTEALELRLLDIVEIGLGGYVVGRTLEKIAPQIAGALKR